MRKTFVHAPMHSWVVWAVASGQLLWQEGAATRRVRAPAALLLWPGRAQNVQAPAGSEWWHLRFDLIADASDGAQLSPSELWNLDPSHVIPDLLVPGTITMMRQTNALWWRDAINHMRANYYLTRWLLDWLDFVRQGDAAGDRSLWLQEVQGIITLLLGDGLTVAELAGHVGQSTTAFCKRFRQETGVTPGAELRRQRVERACHLLRTTTKNLEQIAARCGYASPYSFCHGFRALMGTSPMAWRRSRTT